MRNAKSEARNAPTERSASGKAQNLVTLEMSVAVIHLFKFMKVEYHHRETMAITPWRDSVPRSQYSSKNCSPVVERPVISASVAALNCNFLQNRHTHIKTGDAQIIGRGKHVHDCSSVRETLRPRRPVSSRCRSRTVVATIHRFESPINQLSAMLRKNCRRNCPRTDSSSPARVSAIRSRNDSSADGCGWAASPGWGIYDLSEKR